MTVNVERLRGKCGGNQTQWKFDLCRSIQKNKNKNIDA